MAILTIEVYSVLNQAFEMYKAGGINPGQLKGVTANRNITAVCIKIPYIIYRYLIQKKSLKILYTFLIFLSLLHSL